MSALGFNLGVTSRESIGAFLLLSIAAHGHGKEVDMRMLNGLAVKMCLEMGLHLVSARFTRSVDGVCSPLAQAPTIDNIISPPEDERLDRLAFWAVLIHDCTIAISDGVPTSINPAEVTARLPTEDDIHLTSLEDDDAETPANTPLRSPFPYLARTLLTIGNVCNVINANVTPSGFGLVPEMRDEILGMIQKISVAYDETPLDMVWTGAK